MKCHQNTIIIKVTKDTIAQKKKKLIIDIHINVNIKRKNPRAINGEEKVVVFILYLVINLTLHANIFTNKLNRLYIMATVEHLYCIKPVFL